MCFARMRTSVTLALELGHFGSRSSCLGTKVTGTLQNHMCELKSYNGAVYVLSVCEGVIGKLGSSPHKSQYSTI